MQMHQNHLKGLLKPKSPRPTPRVSGSLGLGGRQFAFLQSSQVKLILLVWGMLRNPLS